MDEHMYLCMNMCLYIYTCMHTLCCLCVGVHVYNYNDTTNLGEELIAELASVRPEKDVVVEFNVSLYIYIYR